MQVDSQDEMIQQVQYKIQWCYYDEEDEFDKLIESCNLKGVKERKLVENLRKIAERLKLKKSKKAANKIIKDDKKDEDVQMIDEENKEEKEEEEEES